MSAEPSACPDCLEAAGASRGSLGSCWAVCRCATSFPPQLLELDDRVPPVIFGTGDRAVLDRLERDSTVTIVGSRRATPYGLGMARELAHLLAPPASLSSAAWPSESTRQPTRGALEGGGTTVAVLGGGADVAYPPSSVVCTGASPQSRHCNLRAPARYPAREVGLSRPQPDHGGHRRDDRGRRGGGALRIADHGRGGRAAQPVPGRRAGARLLANVGGPARADPRRGGTHPRCPGRARRNASAWAPPRFAPPARSSTRLSRSCWCLSKAVARRWMP